MFAIYQNIVKYTNYRKINIVSPTISQSDLDTELKKTGYVIITARDNANNRNVYIYLINEGSNIPNITQEFKKLFPGKKSSSKASRVKVEPGAEIIIISEKGLSTQIIKSFRETFKDNVRHNFSYALFLSEIPLHSYPHTVLSPSEANDLLQQLCITPEQLPKIEANDPQALWIGATPGQIVKIERKGETTGVSLAYRLVI